MNTTNTFLVITDMSWTELQPPLPPLVAFHKLAVYDVLGNTQSKMMGINCNCCYTTLAKQLLTKTQKSLSHWLNFSEPAEAKYRMFSSVGSLYKVCQGKSHVAQFESCRESLTDLPTLGLHIGDTLKKIILIMSLNS